MFDFVRNILSVPPEEDMTEVTANSASRPSYDKQSQPDQENSSLMIASCDKFQKICEDLSRKLDKAEAQARISEDKAMEFEKEMRISKRAQLLHQEQYRRLGELLENSRQIAATALEENRGLVLKVAHLQRCTEVMSDDEIRQTMRQLYQNLENWTNIHFSSSIPNENSHRPNNTQDNDSIPGDNRLNALHEIHGRVYELIFRSFLVWHLVGIDEEYLDCIFRTLDEEIQAKCPIHIWYQWNSATSIAVSALAESKLKWARDHIIQIVETEFGCYSRTDPAIRKKQLDDLLLRFIEFKRKLERQNDRYLFWQLVPGMPLNDETMASLTGECPPHGIVHSIMSPVLSKCGPARGEHTVVHKAVVKLMPGFPHGGREVDSEREQA